MSPAPLRLVPMERDTLAERRRPAEMRRAEAERFITAHRAAKAAPEWSEDGTRLNFWMGFKILPVPAWIRVEVLALLTLGAEARERERTSGLRWAEKPGGVA